MWPNELRRARSAPALLEQALRHAPIRTLAALADLFAAMPMLDPPERGTSLVERIALLTLLRALEDTALGVAPDLQRQRNDIAKQSVADAFAALRPIG